MSLLEDNETNRPTVLNQMCAIRHAFSWLLKRRHLLIEKKTLFKKPLETLISFLKFPENNKVVPLEVEQSLWTTRLCLQFDAETL